MGKTNFLALAIAILSVALSLMVLGSLIPRFFLNLHEFGHGAIGLMFAQSSAVDGQNVTFEWAVSENGPTQTKLTGIYFSKLQRSLFSIGGGIAELLFAALIILSLKKAGATQWKSLFNSVLLAYLLSAIGYSMFNSIIFADTDGFALGPRMVGRFGQGWSILSSAVTSVVLWTMVLSLGVAIIVVLYSRLEGLSSIRELDNRYFHH